MVYYYWFDAHFKETATLAVTPIKIKNMLCAITFCG